MRGFTRFVAAVLAPCVLAPSAGQAIFWRETFLTFDTPFATFDDRDPQISRNIVVWRRFDPFSIEFDLWFAVLGDNAAFTAFKMEDGIPSALAAVTYHLNGASLVWSKGDSIFHRDFSNGTSTEIPLPDGATIRRDTIRVDSPYILWTSEAGQTYAHELDGGGTRLVAEEALFQVLDAPWAMWSWDGVLFLHQLETGSTTPVATGHTPALAAPHLVFRGADELLHYDIETAQLVPLADSEGVSEGPHLDGSHVLWTALTGSTRVIRLHDLESGITTTISNPEADSFRPALAGHNALFIERQADGTGILYAYDIPSQTLVPVRQGVREFSGPRSSNDSAVHRELRQVEQVAVGDIVWVWRDDDEDGDPNDFDTCRDEVNPDQRDTDGDGFGNACDPDLNGDGVADFLDLALLLAVFGTDDPDADLDGDGTVGESDVTLLKRRFFAPPGPAGPAA